MEVNQQIPLMGDIYLKASCVNVWLGEIDEDTASSAIRAITLLAGFYWPLIHLDDSPEEGGDEWNEIYYHARRRLNALRDLHPRDFPSEYEPTEALPSQDMNHLLKIFSHPWFTRARTYQESRLATSKLFSFGPHCLQTCHLQAALCSLKDCLFYYMALAEGVSWQSPRIAPNRSLRLLIAARRSGDLKSILHDDQIEPLVICEIAQDMLKDRTMPGCCDVWKRQSQLVSDEVSLDTLLWERRGAQCTVQSDLVYSLLGLASDGEKIRPDVMDSWQEVFIETVADLVQTRSGLDRVLLLASDQPEAAGLPSWVPDWRFSWRLTWLHFFEGHQPCPGHFKRSVTISACHRRIFAKGYIEDIVDEVWNPKVDMHIPHEVISEAGEDEFDENNKLVRDKDKNVRVFTTKKGKIGEGCSRAEPGDEIAVVYGVCQSLMIRRSRPEQSPDRNGSSRDESEPSVSYRYVGQCCIYSNAGMKHPSNLVDKNLEPILPEGREEQIIVIE